MSRDFHDRLAEKKNIYTKEKVLKDLQETLNSTKHLIAVQVTDDGEIIVINSDDIENIQAIGILEMAKQTIINDSFPE